MNIQHSDFQMTASQLYNVTAESLVSGRDVCLQSIPPIVMRASDASDPLTQLAVQVIYSDMLSSQRSLRMLHVRNLTVKCRSQVECHQFWIWLISK